MSGTGSPLIEVKNLTVRYGEGVEALHGVDLIVRDGSVVALIGGNGAGKSTLLRTISSVIEFSGGRVSDGTIRMGQTVLTSLSPSKVVAAGISHVPEGRRVFSSMTVEDNLRAGGARVRGRRERERRIARAFDIFEALGRLRTRPAGLLSGGEQQMLAIARGMMTRPRVLMLDEPSLGLAPQIVAQVGQVIRAINAEGTTVVLVEQNAAMALRVADEGYVLERGRIVLRGTATELRATSEIQQLYLGGAADEPDAAADTESNLSLTKWVAHD